MRVLILAPLHHPDELAAARAATPPGESPPLFPPSQAQHFWQRALQALGHTVGAFYRSAPALPIPPQIAGSRLVRGASQRFPRLNPDYRARNARLLDAARRFRPDALLMAGDNEVIYPDTLARLKAETGATLVYMCGTSPIVFSHANERAAAPLYDLVIANDYYHGIQWRELGARHMEALPMAACWPDFHHPYDLTDDERRAYACDVSFVGTLWPPNLYSRRVAALEALREFDLSIWSVHTVPESLRPYLRGKALGEKMLRVLCGGTITVNPHGDFMLYGGNMRLFEAAAVGAFQIADDLPGVRQWFTPGETIAVYRDPRDLRDQVAYYLTHPEERRRIAAAAQQHVYANHTYHQRMARIMGMVEELRA